MSSEGAMAVTVSGLGKCFHIYDAPRDRLRQIVVPRLQRALGRTPSRYFTEFWAVRDVSLRIQRGHTVGIVGRNGSGKSTLLQMICGTVTPSAGTVAVDGRIAALLELGSGFHPEFTGRENVRLNAAILGIDDEGIRDKMPEIIAFAEIGDFIDRPVKTYSSGMLVRLAFSVAACVDPDVLVVDEALSVGDERFQRKCFGRIEQIRDSGATILFVSHSGATVTQLCDEAILLDDGELLERGPPKRVVADYQRLLYAPAERRSELRSRLAAGQPPSIAEGAVANSFAEPDEAFDPTLVPTSTVEYIAAGARIEAPLLTTLEGRKVNVLKAGQRYRYCYRVRFEGVASQVRFGMLVKTTSGLELGGAESGGSLERHCVDLVEAGSMLDVSYEFTCALNPGVYFMNAGVLGDPGTGEVSYLHRLLDAVMFRVVGSGVQIGTGPVDLSCAPGLSEIHGEAVR
jgi:lipopolysaccharide transport system ATP-binding protein